MDCGAPLSGAGQDCDMHYVYIIKSKIDSSYYVGFTNDLKRRIAEHNGGLVRFTSSRIPYTLIWYSAFVDKCKALNFEKYLKHGSGFAFSRKHLI